MTLHVFNPEHDIALASGLANFTAPRAGRQLHADLAFLPVLWAHADDAVWVEDRDAADRQYQRLVADGWMPAGQPRWVTRAELGRLSVDHIAPWGWDAALCHSLRQAGVSSRLLPDGATLEHLRHLSHRATGSRLLTRLRSLDFTVGEAVECHDIKDVRECVARWGRVVLKSPWSSSGRGVRFVDLLTAPLEQWAARIMEQQGCVMAEPYYVHDTDFGMEFCRHADGTVDYLGLSLFHTVRGAYVGNVLADEDSKRNAISRYIPVGWLDTVQEIISRWDGLDGYEGPFGVDMMICAAPPADRTVPSAHACMLHPCVELNLRRTMGHVSLALTPPDAVPRVMRIAYSENKYLFQINKL